MRKNRLQIVRFVLLFGAVFFLFGFANIRNSQREISDTEIVFVDEEELFFLNQETVNNLLIQYNSGYEIVTKDALNLKLVEGLLDAHENIEKAEVSVAVDGVLKVVVRQKKPLVRVVTDDFSYYVDDAGEVFPMSEYYAARVPLVSGAIKEGDWEACLSLFRYLDADDFLRKNIIGMEIAENGEISMKNRDFRYTILFGRPECLKQKFRNYKAFFKKATNDSTITKYRSINLKYAQQVVCAQ